MHVAGTLPGREAWSRVCSPSLLLSVGSNVFVFVHAFSFSCWEGMRSVSILFSSFSCPPSSRVILLFSSPGEEGFSSCPECQHRCVWQRCVSPMCVGSRGR